MSLQYQTHSNAPNLLCYCFNSKEYGLGNSRSSYGWEAEN